MRKAFKGAAELGGVLLVLAGLVVCMCETPGLDKQLLVSGAGIAMMAAGALVVYLTKEKGTEYGRYDYL